MQQFTFPNVCCLRIQNNCLARAMMDEQEENASSSQQTKTVANLKTTTYSPRSVNSPTKSSSKTAHKTPTTTPIRPQSRASVLSRKTGRRVPVIDLTDGM
jgi:hypothetical protein